MKTPKKKAGVAWYRAEQYERIRRTFLDGHKLPVQYADWLASTHSVCDQIIEEGREVIRVEIDPDKFLDWCRTNHFRADSRGRECYVKLMTFRIATEQAMPFSDSLD